MNRRFGRSALVLDRLRGGQLLLEAVNAAFGVDKFLLTREEGMAVGANFQAQIVALDGRLGLPSRATSTVGAHFVIVGVDSGFHSKE